MDANLNRFVWVGPICDGGRCLYDTGTYTTLPDLPRAYGITDAGDVARLARA